MTKLLMIAAGRSAAPLITSPIRMAFISDPRNPSSATTADACMACRRSDSRPASAAQPMSRSPTRLGMKAVRLEVPETT